MMRLATLLVSLGFWFGQACATQLDLDPRAVFSINLHKKLKPLKSALARHAK
jgi:hypothetical protein